MNSKVSTLLFSTCLCLLIFSQHPCAQAQKIIQGKVVDVGTHLPIPGVTVQVKGSPQATTTDESGDYSLNIKSTANSVLVFSYVGYVGKEVQVSGSRISNVSLQPGTDALNEVVVTGYTAEKKKDIIGAVSVVNVSDMVKQPSALITEQLQGQASGVTVISSGQPGVDPQIRIRGINTFGNNTPLYVVDGVPTQNISDINANDIASIQVLKDAGASSIYGSRASNGVIILTTKRGRGKVNLQYDAYAGTQRPKKGNVWNLLNPQEQANLEWQAVKNSGAVPNDPLYGSGATPVLPDYIAPQGAKEGDPSVNPSLYYINPNFTDLADYGKFYRITRANKTGTDWYHEVFKPALTTSHNLMVNGGNDQGSYLFSVNYLNQQGSLLETYLKRYTIRANATYNLTKNIRIGENLSASVKHNPRVADLQGNTPIFFTLQTPTIVPVYDIKGNYAGVNGTSMNGPNAVALLRRTAHDTYTDNRIFGNMFAEITFLKNFTLRSNFGGENFSGSSQNFNYPTYENSGNATLNSFSQNSSWGYSWTWTNTLSYHKQFGNDHDLKLLGGIESYKLLYENMGGNTQNYFSFDPNFFTLSAGSGNQTNYGARSKESLSSEFARVDYSYKDKYLLNGTLRRDGSSKFVKYQYGWFPAVSAGWRISHENFMKDIRWLSDMKIRGSWGALGNQLNVNQDNGYFTFVGDKSTSYYDIAGTNNSNQPGFQEGQIANPNARWEKDITANIGIDATLFDNQLDIVADFYRKDIKGLLFNPAVPGTQGVAPAPFINVASSRNQGLDLALSVHEPVSRDFKIDAGITLTTYNNKITHLSDNADYFWTTDRRVYGDYFIRNQAGHPIGSFYGYKIIGFWNSQDEIAAADKQAVQSTGNPNAVYQAQEGVGRFRYADINHSGQITDSDRTFLGNPNPKFTYGFNFKMTYKNFDMSLFIYGVQGNKLWNVTRFWTDFYSSYNNAKSKTALYNSWTPQNHNARAPIQEAAMTTSTNGAPNSYYVENGSYLRLKNIQLGYSFPQTALSRVGIARLRIYIQAANLFTITKYTGIDPEISGSVTEFGVDEGIYPSMRQFLAGINLGF